MEPGQVSAGPAVEVRMVKLVEMDERLTLQEQMQQEVGPVFLINKFTVKPDEADQLLKAWADDTSYMKRQPGFSLLNFTEASVEAACLSIMPSGIRSNTSGAPSAIPIPRTLEGLSAEFSSLPPLFPEARCARILCCLGPISPYGML
jgi:hypothetical protein